MNKVEKLLHERYIEFWGDIYNIEKEEIYRLKDYIDYVESTLRNYSMMDLSYERIKDLFMMKHLDYVEEALSCMLQGNYSSLSCMIRILIENYITFFLIKKYKTKELWKYWYVYGSYKATRIMGDEPFHSKAIKNYNDMCEILNIEDNNIFDNQSYSWLRKVVKLKRYNFKQVCNLVDLDLYKDFNYLSERVHSNNMLFKTFGVDMRVLSKFIFTIYDLTDKTIRLYDHRYLRRIQYNVLCTRLLESLQDCIDFKEELPGLK